MSLRKKAAMQYIRTKFKLLAALSKRKAAEQAFQFFCTPQSKHIKELTENFRKAETLQFPVDGETVRGYRWNPSHKKVLILHGFESAIINFDPYIMPLVKKGYEVLAFDAPAHGRSTGKTITVLIYKNFIKAIIDRYGPITSFVSHSFGGLALMLALEELKHDASYKVVLMAPATETITSINQYFHLFKMKKEVRKEFDQVIKDISGVGPEWFSINRAAAHIKAQVLWIHDADDAVTPFSDTLITRQAAYPNFTFIITKGLGHSRLYKEASTIKQAVDFL